MTDHHDDRIRDALRAEATGVEADPGLLDRINAEVSTPERTTSHRARRLLVVAAAFAIAGATVALLTRDNDDAPQRIETADDPTSTLPPETDCDPANDVTVHLSAADMEDVTAVRSQLDAHPRVVSHRLYYGEADPEAPGMAVQIIHVDVRTEEDKDAVVDDLRTRPGVTDASANPPCRPDEQEVALPEAGPRPDKVAFVRDDGWLVTVDLTTGEQTELYDGGDPDDRDPETGMTTFIDGIEVSPDGQWVHFSVCCEPAGGQSFRVPANGPATTEPERSVSGYLPRFSPDGSRIVTLAGGLGLSFLNADGLRPEFGTLGDLPDWLNQSVHDLSWSPDGSMVAVATEDPQDPEGFRVHYLASDGDGVTPLGYGSEVQTDRRQFPIWGITDSPQGQTFGPLFRDPAELDGLRWLTQDRTYAWLLWVDADGDISYSGTHDVARTRLNDLPGVGVLPAARLADW